MKRTLPIFLSCIILLSGCTSGRRVETTYPRLEYRNSTHNFDPYNRELNIEDGYILDEGHSYDIVETDVGFDIVLHFVKAEQEEEN